jgi:Na+-driven multidrug efflux pump
MHIILIGLAFHLFSAALAALAQVEGVPRLAMVAGVSNIIFDWLFIAIFDWGVSEAACATVVGKFIGFSIMVWHFFLSGRSLLKIRARELLIDSHRFRHRETNMWGRSRQLLFDDWRQCLNSDNKASLKIESSSDL